MDSSTVAPSDVRWQLECYLVAGGPPLPCLRRTLLREQPPCPKPLLMLLPSSYKTAADASSDEAKSRGVALAA
eukprot:SAG11_NODE_24965_length_365_cov_0.977444_1_plen_72_part_01